MDQDYISNMTKSEHTQHMNDINNRIMELGKENGEFDMTNKNIMNLISSVESDTKYTADEKWTLLQHLFTSIRTNSVGFLIENIKDVEDMLKIQEINLNI